MKDIQSSQKIRSGMIVALTAFALVGALMVVSCNDDESSGDGSTTVSGVVETFSGGTAYFKATHPSVWAGLLDLAVSPAFAGVAGVTVRVAGTDIEVTTGEDGSFVLTGVPEGPQQLIFSMGGVSSTLDLDVPANATIILNDVNVDGDSVSVGSIEVTSNDEDANENDDVDDNANDNDGGSENDNVVVDENDNVVVDENDNV